MERRLGYLAGFGLTALAILWAGVSRKRASAAADEVNESEQRYRVLVESAPDAICVHRQSRILYANSAAARLFRAADPAEFVGRPVLDFIHPDAREHVIERLRLLNAGQEVPTIEEQLITLDGDVRDVEVKATPIRYEGAPAVQVIMRDITERRRAQATLRQSLSLLRATLESTADGILVVDKSGQIVIFSQKFADMWGLSDQVLDARSDDAALEAVAGSLVDPEAYRAGVRAIYDRPDEETFDIVELKDGRVFERYSQPQRIAGATVGRVWSFRDVTDRRRAERVLEDVAGKLISAQEEERSRIGRELHDHVSQQLALMAIRLDQLRADYSPATDNVAAMLGRLRQDTSELIEDVYRISHRLHSSMLEQLGLVRALQRLVSEFSEGHDMPIEFTSTPVASPVSPEVALCLFRVGEEALTNVAKHSGARSARVDVDTRGDGIRIVVEDAGVGFDPTTFEQAASLGLVSMRERLRLVRGTIRIQSAPNQGTRIEAWAPWAAHSEWAGDEASADPAGRRPHLDGRSPAAPLAN
jgi:PAS domain S-box-containing protein